ncbi:hypothetical protein F5Y15DRAFT_413543 [Xylariaceae sp. FL0016]|nr:hypothetical protein F5Y15DRAFT_413543 [Xylariaceae sp. FL0016]
MANSVASLSQTINNDPQWQAFLQTDAIVEPVNMGVTSVGASDPIMVNINAKAETRWEKFFGLEPKAP